MDSFYTEPDIAFLTIVDPDPTSINLVDLLHVICLLSLPFTSFFSDFYFFFIRIQKPKRMWIVSSPKILGACSTTDRIVWSLFSNVGGKWNVAYREYLLLYVTQGYSISATL
jgi:hypothetical protein